MKILTDPIAENDLETADGLESEKTFAGEAAIEITDPGEMIHATAIAGARMILLT